jgi:hypothetical protein
MPANEPRSNGEYRNGDGEPGEPLDPLREVEELRAPLPMTLTRTSRLIAALKQQRRQGRVVESALTALRRLPLGKLNDQRFANPTVPRQSTWSAP